MPETVKLVYSGKRAVIVPDAGLEVEPGETVSVPVTIADSLLARPGWAKAEKKAPQKGA